MKAGQPFPGPRLGGLAAATALIAIGCSSRSGIPLEGSVNRKDGRPVAEGEVWLEPEGDHATWLRPVRRPIEAGRFSFPATDGIQPGRWTVRIYPPSLGSGASDAEVASLFEPTHEPLTLVPPAASTPVTLDFEVGPLRGAAP